jgi:predicted DNA-binding protein (MmcQ/YjbR family)
MRPLAAHCRTLPGVTEEVKWGDDLVFSVAEKMFCVFSIEGGQLVRLSVKVDDHRFLEYTDRPQFIPAPYLARAHWVSVVDRKGLTPAELKAMIARSHALVVAKLPRKAQAAMLAKGVTAKRPTAAARARAMPKGGRFVATLFKWPGPGGWHFAPVPKPLAPPVTRAWGRTPVEATVEGHTWNTSVWRGKDGRVLLAVPKKVRGAKGHGDKVKVTIRYRD